MTQKLETEWIVEALRADGEPKLLLIAADRLEELQKEFKNISDCIQQWRDELNKLHEEKRFLKEQFSYMQIALVNEITDGKKACERVKLLELQLEQQVSPVCPEPSRLEIAAMMMAANLSRETDQWETVKETLWAVEQADALMKAATEEK